MHCEENVDEVEVTAAIKIQASTRGFFARRRYRMPSAGTCTDYLLRIQGNDPVINMPISSLPGDRVVLIGTSGLRTLEIACKLGSDCPKIFLIDNSQHVIQFWKDLQVVIQTATSVCGVMANVAPVICQCSECVDAIDDRTGYLASLVQEHGFEKVRRIILHASIILQNWTDKRTFDVILNFKELNNYQRVYVYASNIVTFMAYNNQHSEAKAILENIVHLDPDLAVHTDLVRRVRPQNVFYYSKGQHDVEDVFSTLTSYFRHRVGLKESSVYEYVDEKVKVLAPQDPEIIRSLGYSV